MRLFNRFWNLYGEIVLGVTGAVGFVLWLIVTLLVVISLGIVTFIITSFDREIQSRAPESKGDR